MIDQVITDRGDRRGITKGDVQSSEYATYQGRMTDDHRHGEDAGQ